MDYMEKIDKIVSLFYANKEKEANLLFASFLDFMTTNLISGATNTNVIESILIKLLSSIEKKDYITAADLLHFGLVPILNGDTVSDNIFYFDSENLSGIEENIFYLESFMDNELVLCKKEGGTVYNLNSFFSPSNEIEYLLRELDIKTTTPAVCLFGLGTGQLAECILNKLNFDGKLIIYEPDRKIMDYCLKNNDNDCEEAERKISSRIKKVINDKRTFLCIEEENAIKFARVLESEIDRIDLVGLKIIRSYEYERLYPYSSIEFLKHIRNHNVSVVTNRNTYKYFSNLFLENSLKNIRRCKKAFLCSELKRIIPPEIPVFIVSAGPSLEKNIGELKKIKGHGLIFAVDTALKNLLKQGIIPDLTITIDAEKPVENFEQEISKDIPCIFSCKSNPSILDNQNGELIFLDGQEGYVDGLLERIGKKTIGYWGTGGSVATAAFAVAYMLKSNYIVLIGQDLAYDGDVSHAGGIKERTEHKDSYVESIYGDQIRTRSDWVSYIRWFEDAVKLVKEKNERIKVVDATEGGAKIHGTEIKTLKETIEEINELYGSIDYDFSKELRKLSLMLSDEEYAELCSIHKSAINNLAVVDKEIDEAIQTCADLLLKIESGMASQNYIHKQNKKLKTCREHLEKNQLYVLIKTYVEGEDLSEIAKLELQETNVTTTQANLVKAMKLFFEVNLDALRKVYEKARQYETLLD